jgi:serine/threonine-protein kinase RsbW
MPSTVSQEIQVLTLASRIESINEAASVAAEVGNRLGFGEEALFGIDMAVREAVTNAVLHGNRQEADKSIEVTFADSPAELTITVRDEGEGFDPEAVADPTVEQNLLKTSGRGILFMRNFMDEVEYSRPPQGGTIVRMTKRR